MAEKTELQIVREHKPSSAGIRWLRPGAAIHLGRRPGELTVLEGRAWLTRSHDVADYVLMPGERVLLEQSHRAVIESAARGQGVTYCWRPHCEAVADLEPRSRVQRALQRLALTAPANETAEAG